MKAIIYSIENIKNGDCYIGSTTNHNRRKSRHFEDLRNGNHHSIILQRAFNKYGESNFCVYVIESFTYSSKEEILSKEQDYLDAVNPKYNVCVTAGSQLGSVRNEAFKKACAERMRGKEPWNKGKKTGKHSETHKKNRSAAMIGHVVKPSTRDKIKVKVSKPVIQYDNDGNFIREWESAKQASIELSFNYTSLIKYLNGNSNISTFKNWIWKRK